MLKSARHAWHTIVSGTCASVVSSIVLVYSGKKEAGSYYAPTNAISHWIWGDVAARQDGPSLRYTATGYVIHHLSSTFWAALFLRRCARSWKRGAVPAMATASAATAVACFVDYKLTPHRLQPGFEQRLSKKSLAAVYVGFGAGLLLGAYLCRKDLP